MVFACWQFAFPEPYYGLQTVPGAAALLATDASGGRSYLVKVRPNSASASRQWHAMLTHANTHTRPDWCQPVAAGDADDCVTWSCNNSASMFCAAGSNGTRSLFGHYNNFCCVNAKYWTRVDSREACENLVNLQQTTRAVAAHAHAIETLPSAFQSSDSVDKSSSRVQIAVAVSLLLLFT
jgi:hypothetical protein